MNSAVELMDAGFECLVERQGVVDAERFIAMIKRDGFDYTSWRRKYFDKMDLDQVSEKAAIYAKSHLHNGPLLCSVAGLMPPCLQRDC